VAQRQWILMEWGISVQCFCEKGWQCKSARRLLARLPRNRSPTGSDRATVRQYRVPIYRIRQYQQQGVPANPQAQPRRAWKNGTSGCRALVSDGLQTRVTDEQIEKEQNLKD
jgi:hypothetical protein